MNSFTGNVRYNCVDYAKSAGYHAYYANGVTAIEIKANTKEEASKIASVFGTVLYVFI